MGKPRIQAQKFFGQVKKKKFKGEKYLGCENTVENALFSICILK